MWISEECRSHTQLRQMLLPLQTKDGQVHVSLLFSWHQQWEFAWRCFLLVLCISLSCSFQESLWFTSPVLPAFAHLSLNSSLSTLPKIKQYPCSCTHIHDTSHALLSCPVNLICQLYTAWCHLRGEASTERFLEYDYSMDMSVGEPLVYYRYRRIQLTVVDPITRQVVPDCIRKLLKHGPEKRLSKQCFSVVSTWSSCLSSYLSFTWWQNGPDSVSQINPFLP